MPTRTQVFMDNIGITIPVPRCDWEVSTENLHHAIHRGRSLSPAKNNKAYKLYNYAWTARIPGIEKSYVNCLIQVWPKFGSAYFVRIEWTPSKAVAYAKREIMSLLARCIPNFYIAWEQARLSRVDITFDVYDLSIEEVYVFSDSSRTTARRYFRNEGRLNGCYLGSAHSNRRLVVYDKLHHLSQGRRSGVRAVVGTESGRARTRFEFRFRDLGYIRNADMFENGLSRYSIALVSTAQRHYATRHWTQFIYMCDNLGAQSAISLIRDRKKRRDYRLALKEYCSPDWYERAVIWQEATALISSLQLPNIH